MAFKKIRMNSGEEILEAKVLDTSGMELERHRIMLSDLDQWIYIIKRKYGLFKKDKSIDKDLDWAK